MRGWISVVLTLLITCLFVTGFVVQDAYAKVTLKIYADPNAVHPDFRYVEAGDKVSFSASGTWSPTAGITCGPEGTGETATSAFFFPGEPKYSLCLMFSGHTSQTSTGYYIGRGTTITFQESGYFFLRINSDDDPNATPTGYVTVNLQSGDAVGGDVAELADWQNPVTTQAYRTFQNTVFAEKVEPIAAAEEKTEKGLVKPNEASSAVEYEFFKIGGLEGNNLTINFGIARSNDDQTRWYGINAYLNTLSFNGGKSFNNSNFSFFGIQKVRETDTSSISLGVTLDYLLLDGGYSDDDGIGIGTIVSGTNSLGNSFLSWGGMYQYAKLGKYLEHIANLGVMYGVPIGELFAVTGDLFGTYKMSASYDGETVDLDEPFLLNLGLYGDFYISRLFMINGGVKKVLLVEDYTSTEIVIGAKVRF